MIVINKFHLGKKSVSYMLDDNTDVLLYGQTILDDEQHICKLELMSTEVQSGEDSLPETEGNIVATYIARSNKFKNGEFDEFDAGRYLKSRYRDLFDRLKHDEGNRRTILHHHAIRLSTATEPNPE